MTKRRARLNDDNDPLSSTDKVLAGFEQISKSTSQQDEVSTSQEADKLTNQPDKLLTSQEADKPTSHQDEVSTSQEADKSTRQQSKSEYTLDALTSQPDTDSTPIIQPNSNSTSEKANFLTSQQVNVEKVSLRKSTFQISEEVLHQLDKLHLTLQLKLGKAHAPYKEVIVEEALVQLLESFNSDRAALIEVLMSRQKSRDKL